MVLEKSTETVSLLDLALVSLRAARGSARIFLWLSVRVTGVCV